MKKALALAVALFAATVTLVSCGGGGGKPPATQVAATDTTLATDSTSAPAVVNVPFTFDSGVSAFGTTSPTTVTFTNTSTTPAFSIATATGTATGTTQFGSCIFAISAVTGSVGSMKVGDTITVNPCNLNINTAGATANGVAVSRSIALLLGAAASAKATISLAVNAGGQLTLNGRPAGTVTLTFVTG
jgi:hypothetical protein